MKKKVTYVLLAGAVVSALTGLIALDLGPGTTPLAKFFLVFFGAIVVLQCIPALLLFGCIVKELLFGSKAALDQGQGSRGNPS